MTSDLELLDAWRQGNREAGGELFERYFDSICRFFANKVDRDVEDLVQRTFAACVEGQTRYRGDASFRSYLFGAAHNILRSYLRERGRDQARFDFGLTSVFDLGLNPSILVGERAEQILLLNALRHLNIDHQIVLELYYWEDMTAAELGTMLGIPEGTVRGRIRRAKQLLEQKLTELAQSEAILESTLTGLESWAKGLREKVLASG